MFSLLPLTILIAEYEILVIITVCQTVLRLLSLLSSVVTIPVHVHLKYYVNFFFLIKLISSLDIQ